MDIFESLENLNVSEECFEDIVGLVEEYLSETNREMRYKAAKNSLSQREEQAKKVGKELGELVDKHNYEPSGDMYLVQPKGWPYGNSKTVPEVEKKREEYTKALARVDKAKDIINSKGEGKDYVLAQGPSDRSFSSHEKIVKLKNK